MNKTASFQVLPSSEEVESASLPRVTPILGCFMKACALWQTTMTPFGSNTAETFEFGFCNGVACGVSQLSPLSAECETYMAPRLVRKNCTSRPSRNGPTMDPSMSQSGLPSFILFFTCSIFASVSWNERPSSKECNTEA